ncbi:hypothetical protein [Parabacteroides pacaensis]|uniref:hypothetical protein n=1 Tax=Parabacteroides pacaensis TaxID=2086575 RepID=UPI000D0E8AA0|nr:hypothetical protein [Parabacteroides pacaensis]
MERLVWSETTPGHLLIIIDQSANMNIISANGESYAEIAAEAILCAVLGCASNCISGRYIKNRFYLTIIGYGGEPTPIVTTIKEGWITDLIPDLTNIKVNGGTFIPVKAHGNAPTAEALDLAKECLECWFEALQEKVDDGSYLGIPSPIIIHITAGNPCDGSPLARIKAMTIANKIISLSGSDGNVKLFNIYLSENDSEIIFPATDENISESSHGKFYYHLSSSMSEDMVNMAKIVGFEDVCVGAKCVVVNAKYSSIASFISFASNQGFYTKCQNIKETTI